MTPPKEQQFKICHNCQAMFTGEHKCDDLMKMLYDNYKKQHGEI